MKHTSPVLCAMLRAVILGCAVAVLASCAAGPRQAPLAPTAIESVQAVLLDRDRAWSDAAATRDIDRIIEFWTHDAVIGFQQGPPAVIGRKAIRGFISKNREDPGFAINWTPRQAWVSADGTTGCTFGVGTMQRTNADGRVVTSTDPYTCVWRLERGVWRCVLDLRTPTFNAPEH